MQPSSTTCDRRCLLQFLTDYTKALTDNDTSRLAVAPTLKVTNNGNASALGKGDVWGPGRQLTSLRTFVNPATGVAVFHGMVTNATDTMRPDAPSSPGLQRWWYWTLRLKIENRRIVEVEEMAYERRQLYGNVQGAGRRSRYIFAFFRGNGHPNSGWPDVPAR